MRNVVLALLGALFLPAALFFLALCGVQMLISYAFGPDDRHTTIGYGGL
jgi:hypothetical protein